MAEQAIVTFDGRSSVTGAPCFLQLTLLSRPYAHTSEPWDRDGIDCEVRVHADAFEGHYATAVWGHELMIIRAVLAAAYERVGQAAGAIIDDLLENPFDIKLILTPLGHLTLEVAAHGHPAMGPNLQFSMEADQSYLPLWLKQLDRALAMFPPEIAVDSSDPLGGSGR